MGNNISFDAYVFKYFKGDYSAAQKYLLENGIVKGNGIANAQIPDVKPTIDVTAKAPQGFQKKDANKGLRVESSRTQELQSDPFPENNETYRLNQHVKNFKNAEGFWGKTKVAAGVFITDWRNFRNFLSAI